MLPRASENDGSILVSDHVREAPDIVVLPRRSKEKGKMLATPEAGSFLCNEVLRTFCRSSGPISPACKQSVPYLCIQVSHLLVRTEVLPASARDVKLPKHLAKTPTQRDNTKLPSSSAPSVITSHRAVGHQLAAATSMARDSSQYLRLRPL